MLAVVMGRMTPRQRLLFTLACGRRHCRIGEEERYESPEAAAFWLPRKLAVDRLCGRILDAAEEAEGGSQREEVKSLREAVSLSGPLSLNWALTAAVTGD